MTPETSSTTSIFFRSEKIFDPLEPAKPYFPSPQNLQHCIFFGGDAKSSGQTHCQIFLFKTLAHVFRGAYRDLRSMNAMLLVVVVLWAFRTILTDRTKRDGRNELYQQAGLINWCQGLLVFRGA